MDTKSYSRFILLIIAVLNSVLNLLGYETINDELANNIVAVVSGFVILYVGWKNNYLSKKGKAQKEVLEREGLK